MDSKKEFVFKMVTPSSSSSRGVNSGAICSQASKNDTLGKLNSMLGKPDAFTSANTKNLHHATVCIVVEFCMRYYDSIKQDQKKWFYGFEDFKLKENKN
jgi:hypothetical protein